MAARFGGGEQRGKGRQCLSEMLDGHVVLDLECLDRIYLNWPSATAAALMGRHLPALLDAHQESLRGSRGR